VHTQWWLEKVGYYGPKFYPCYGNECPDSTSALQQMQGAHVAISTGTHGHKALPLNMGIVLPEPPQDGGDVSDVSGLRTNLIWIAIFGSGLAIGIALGRLPNSRSVSATAASTVHQDQMLETLGAESDYLPFVPTKA